MSSAHCLFKSAVKIQLWKSRRGYLYNFSCNVCFIRSNSNKGYLNSLKIRKNFVYWWQKLPFKLHQTTEISLRLQFTKQKWLSIQVISLKVGNNKKQPWDRPVVETWSSKVLTLQYSIVVLRLLGLLVIDGGAPWPQSFKYCSPENARHWEPAC